MPEYVKVNSEHTCLFLGEILKVRMWKIRPSGYFYCWVEEDKSKSFHDMFKYETDTFLPATLEEYTQYNNIKKVR